MEGKEDRLAIKHFITVQPDDPRYITREGVEAMRASLEEHPEYMRLFPIVADENLVVLDGKTKLQALWEMGIEDIPKDWIRIVEGLTEEQKNRFRILANGRFSEFNYDVLFKVYEDLELRELGVSVDEFLDRELVEGADIDSIEEEAQYKAAMEERGVELEDTEQVVMKMLMFPEELEKISNIIQEHRNRIGFRTEVEALMDLIDFNYQRSRGSQ